MDGVQLPKATEQLREDSLLFSTRYPEVSGTHFIHLGWMKG